MPRMSRGQFRFLVLGLTSAALVLVAGVLLKGAPPAQEPPAPPPKPRAVPWREPPERFPRDTHLPPRPERHVCGPAKTELFDAGRDLVRIDDTRAWWESDHDTNDTEDDHIIHRAAEVPLRRLIDEVAARNGTLEIQDAYRPSGVHNSRSLHREGRALDVTCDEMSLEALAKLCWTVGFDWVYYEYSGGGGAHIHCSVRRD